MNVLLRRAMIAVLALLPCAPSDAQPGPSPAFSPQGPWEVSVRGRLDGVGRFDGLGVLEFGPFGLGNDVAGEGLLRRIADPFTVAGEWDVAGNGRRIEGLIELELAGSAIGVACTGRVRRGASIQLRGRSPNEGLREIVVRGRRFDPAEVPDLEGDFEGSVRAGGRPAPISATFVPPPGPPGEAPPQRFDVTATTQADPGDPDVEWEGSCFVDSRGEFVLSLSSAAPGGDTQFMSLWGRFRPGSAFRGSGKFRETTGVDGLSIAEYRATVRMRPSP